MMRALWRLSLIITVLSAVTVRAEDEEEDEEAVGAEAEAEDEMAGADGEGMMMEGDDMEGLEQDSLSTEQIRSMHAKMDKNKDGKASMDEVLKFSDEMRKIIAGKDIRSVLSEMDTNKDGKLSLEEFLKDMDSWAGEGSDDEVHPPEMTEEDKKEQEMRKQLETQKFQLADRTKDGMLDVEELPALFYPETHEGVLEVVTLSTMKSKDINGDGKLTAKEFWEGDAHDPEQRDAPISDEEEADFKKLDTNGDGFVNLEEMKNWESGKFHTQEAMKKMFEIADKDNDAHVTADELDNAREQIAGSDAQYHLMEWAEHNEL